MVFRLTEPRYKGLGYKDLSELINNPEAVELEAEDTQGGLFFGRPTKMENISLEDVSLTTKEHRLDLFRQTVYALELPNLSRARQFEFLKDVRMKYVPITNFVLNGNVSQLKELSSVAALSPNGARLYAKGLEADIFLESSPGYLIYRAGKDNFSHIPASSQRVVLEDAYIVYPEDFQSQHEFLLANAFKEIGDFKEEEVGRRWVNRMFEYISNKGGNIFTASSLSFGVIGGAIGYQFNHPIWGALAGACSGLVASIGITAEAKEKIEKKKEEHGRQIVEYAKKLEDKTYELSKSCDKRSHPIIIGEISSKSALRMDYVRMARKFGYHT